MTQERSIRKRLDAIDRLADHLLQHHRERFSAILLNRVTARDTLEMVKDRSPGPCLQYDQDRDVGDGAHEDVIRARNLDETIAKD